MMAQRANNMTIIAFILYDVFFFFKCFTTNEGTNETKIPSEKRFENKKYAMSLMFMSKPARKCTRTINKKNRLCILE